MRWSIAQVARMSGTTSRTLRHYQAEGLLAPAHVGTNGYRYYGRDELLRLQQILVLRELGLGLGDVATALDGDVSRVEVLRRHLVMLERERDRYERLVGTVSRTIEELEGGDHMSEHPEQWFEGFDADKQRAYEAEARERYGDAVVDESKARVGRLSKEQVAEVQDLGDRANQALQALWRDGVPADDPRAVEATDLHYRWVATFWTPDADSYTGLGRMYVDDPRFTAYYDRYGEGFAGYVRDAVAAYAAARL